MKKKNSVLYLLLFLTVTIFFAFGLFPGKELASFLSNTLSTSTLQVSIDNARPSLPWSLSLDNTRISISHGIKINPASAKLTFRPSEIFNRGKQILFYSDIHNGSINGTLQMDTFTPFTLSQFNLEMSEIKLDNFSYKTQLADITLNCRLNGQYKNKITDKKERSGRGKISIQDCSVTLENSFLNTLKIPMVNFSTVTADITRSDHTVSIKNGIATGPSINLTLKGRVNLETPLQNCRLNLAGVMKLDSLHASKFAAVNNKRFASKSILNKGIAFKLNGTIKNPKITL